MGLSQSLGFLMAETFNGLWDFDVLFARWSQGVREVLNNLQRVDQKVAFIQDQLILLLRKNDRHSSLVEYCVQTLKSADGRVPIQELVQQTGYSRRYLDLLFRQHVGLSPKVLAGIFRFQKFYRKWAEGQSFDLLKNDLYEYYYDQLPFTKEFRKMTGYSPRKFSLESFKRIWTPTVPSVTFPIFTIRKPRYPATITEGGVRRASSLERVARGARHRSGRNRIIIHERSVS